MCAEICFIFLNILVLYVNWAQCCILPTTWSGSWTNQQQKFVYSDKTNYIFNSATVSNKHESLQYRLIDSHHFLNRGKCISQKDERYFFYNKHEKCFKCLFIIQRHLNVIQFRETHCDEELTKFEDLCDMLTPDLPLLTMIRENSIPEKCPFTESYQIYSKEKNSLIKSSNFDFYDVPETKPCIARPESDIITKCSDNTMMRLNFQDCFDKERGEIKNEEGISAKCIAHWNEGNLNYLIIQENKQKKQDYNLSKKFKCIIYKDLDRPFKNQNNNILNPSNNLIQLSLSDDELCREFYTTADGSNSFTLVKNSKDSYNSAKNTLKCKFPRAFNKKWSSLDQTKYLFKTHSKILQIKNSKHSKTNGQTDNLEIKFGCIETLNKHFINKNDMDLSDRFDLRNYELQFLVNDLNECSSQKKCLSIYFRSNFIIHLKYANYDPFTQQCLFEDIIYEDLFFVDSNIGVECPFSNRVYQLSSDNKESLNKRSLNGKDSQFSLVFDDDYNTEPECEHFLKIGCKSKDYTIFKKCKFNLNSDENSKLTKRNSISPFYRNYFTHNIYFDSKLPIIESETSRLCLATWQTFDQNDPSEINDQIFVVLSKQLNSQNNSITCSVWETRNNQLKIRDDNSFSSCLNRAKKRKFLSDYKNIVSNGYSMSASAILSNRLNPNDQKITFEYSGSCSSNNSDANRSPNFNFFFFFFLFYY